MSDPLFPWLLILRYMHILGAIALMGGTIFMRFALRPVVVQLPPEIKATVHEQVRSRWSKVVMLATLLILVSGIANLALAGRYEYKPIFEIPKAYHMLVGVKFLLALPIFFIAALMTGRSNLAKRVQNNAEFWMTLNLTLALVMVLMGGMLKFVMRVPKAEMMRAAVTAPLNVGLHSVKARPFAERNATIDRNASQKLPFRARGE